MMGVGVRAQETLFRETTVLVLHNRRLGLDCHSLNSLSECLWSAGTMLVTQGYVHKRDMGPVLVRPRVREHHQVEGTKDNRELVSERLSGRGDDDIPVIRTVQVQG